MNRLMNDVKKAVSEEKRAIDMADERSREENDG
jgi:hypothetical protein